MNGKDFYLAVREMRLYQKRYLKSRDKESLELMKKAQAVVDNEINRVDRIMQRVKTIPNEVNMRVLDRNNNRV